MTDWKSLFGASANQSLDFFPNVEPIIDGSITVKPPPDIIEEGIKDWQFSLVAQFLGKPPNFAYLYRVLSKLWEHKGFLSVKLLGSNLFLLQFTNSESRDFILENGPWHVKSIPMVLRKWEPNLSSLQFKFDKLSLWFQLHQVPLELYTKRGLSFLASTIGTPLYMDKNTATRRRLSYAKLCIEVKAGDAIPNVIHPILGNGSTASVAVSMPWKPSCCDACSVFGHNSAACPKNKLAMQIWQPKQSRPLVESGIVTANEKNVDQKKTSVPDLGKGEVASVVTENDTYDKFTVSLDCEKDFTLVKGSSKAGKGKGKKGNHHLTASTNMFNLLANESLEDIVAACSGDSGVDIPSSSGDVWPQLVAQARTRHKRVASQGLQNILADMKSTKAKNLAKAHQLLDNKALKGKGKKSSKGKTKV